MSPGAIYPSLEGRSVLVTGGASGIGAAIVQAFCKQEAKVGFVDLDSAAAEALQHALSDASGGAPWFRQVDVTDVDALQGAVRDFIETSGGLDVLVNNVGNDQRDDMLEVTEQRWRACMAVNLDPAFFASQAAIRHMTEQGSGSVINLGSINSLIGLPNMTGYIAAKSAILGLTKAMAREFGPAGIRINAILPGWVVTDRQLELWLTPEAEAAWMETVPLKRRLMAEDVASLALFLGADDSSMITNQHFVIDGGRV